MYKNMCGEQLDMNGISYEPCKLALRHAYSNVVWSHKIQEKQSDIYRARYVFWETINTIVTALTAAGIVGIIFTDYFWIQILSSVLSFLTLFITVYLKVFDLATKSALHKESANRLLKIRLQFYLLLVEVDFHTRSDESILQRYRQLNKELINVYYDAPSTTKKAVVCAERELNGVNDVYFIK